ncbi:hypothetical protein [Actinoplanes utahensis]|uniref:Uncharacterized protein n=1 Tax=Actinoplanes utahensis TaxID=1869 RepID=A0A0A6UVE2_ACTUT|nr:hypothetical protein [Actinoplanes utahensis]KHD78389.1 hypothetical protein MB27_06065 [Actinoplanes utahensis]GIF29009.1 hypothetical protein Aut01nite_19950 [Actinoplanes utahensis]
MTTEPTVRDVVDSAIALRLVSAEKAAVLSAWSDRPLSEYGGGAKEAEVAVGVLIDLQVGFEVHSDDVDDLVSGYEGAFEELTACTDGLVTVADVEIVESAKGYDVLRFRLNGELVEWTVEHRGGDYLDQMPFFENMDAFTASAVPKRWALIDIDGEPLPGRYVFGEPAALHAFGERFGITFEVYAAG